MFLGGLEGGAGQGPCTGGPAAAVALALTGFREQLATQGFLALCKLWIDRSIAGPRHQRAKRREEEGPSVVVVSLIASHLFPIERCVAKHTVHKHRAQQKPGSFSTSALDRGAVLPLRPGERAGGPCLAGSRRPATCWRQVFLLNHLATHPLPNSPRCCCTAQAVDRTASRVSVATQQQPQGKRAHAYRLRLQAAAGRPPQTWRP